MRICFISREYPPETGFGGIATFVKHLAHGLKELGHEVVVVALAKEQEKTVNDNGVVVHRVLPYKIEGDLDAVNRCMPYSRYVLLTTLALWRKFFQLHSKQPFDVVDSPELLAESIYASVLRVVPLVIRLYTPHSKFIAENLHNAAATFDHLFVATLERLAMSSADVLTSPSTDLADFVAADLNYPRDQIKIVRNPIDPDEFSPEGDRALVGDGRKTVLFVGRLEERKGIQYLVDAMPKILAVCPDTRFVIIGDDTINAGGGSQHSVLADLKDSLRRSGSIDKVTFIPRIPLSELPSYYRSADVCVVPSVYDNSPYTCLEAMACGRAVVGTSAGGTREYLIDGESGLIVPPKDANALAEAITNLLKDTSFRQSIASNARQRVLDKFQRKKIAQDCLPLYELAMGKFQTRRNLVYLREPEQALPDAAVMLYCFDRMIYNLLYQSSWRFRLNYWRHFLLHRPRLFIAKAVLACYRPFGKLSRGSKQTPPALISWLEKEIASKHRDPISSVLASCGKDS